MAICLLKVRTYAMQIYFTYSFWVPLQKSGFHLHDINIVKVQENI